MVAFRDKGGVGLGQPQTSKGRAGSPKFWNTIDSLTSPGGRTADLVAPSSYRNPLSGSSPWQQSTYVSPGAPHPAAQHPGLSASLANAYADMASQQPHGPGGPSGPAAPAVDPGQSQIDAANALYNHQLQTLAQEVAGGRMAIGEASKHLKLTLSTLGADAQQQDAAIGKRIGGTTHQAAASSAAEAAALAADLHRQGFGAQGVADRAEVQRQAIGAQGRGQSDLSSRYAQLLGQNMNDRSANEALLTSGSQNDLTRANVLGQAGIEQQRAAAILQIQQDVAAAQAAAARAARSGGGGSGGGGGTKDATVANLLTALTQGQKFGGMNDTPPSLQDIINQQDWGGARAGDVKRNLLAGNLDPADEYARLVQQTRDDSAAKKAGESPYYHGSNAGIENALKNIINWKNRQTGKSAQPNVASNSANYAKLVALLGG